MSMLDQLDAYESPHKMPMYPMAGSNLDAHHAWYQAREFYATSALGEEGEYAREVYMNQILHFTSLTNPPVNRIDLNPPEPSPRAKAQRRMDHVFLLIYLTVIILWVLIIVSVA